MKLNAQQYNELKEKLASEIVEKIAGQEEEQQQLTEEQVAAILEAKKRQLAEQEAEAEEEDEVEDEEQEQAEKAASVYQYALNKIAACEQLYADGLLSQQACIETLAEAGLYDEDGLNKEAAESSEEAMFFVEKVAEEYDDALNKVAAAEECYTEAINEANAAIEVLASLGYELN